MNITITTIAHKDQRYETVGDWWFDSQGNIQIFISDMGNKQFEFLVAYHEQCEVMMCLSEGITEEEVTAFDKMFEKERAKGLHTDEAEPGDNYRAPYYKQHQAATIMERQMAAYLNVNWDDYEKAIYAL